MVMVALSFVNILKTIKFYTLKSECYDIWIIFKLKKIRNGVAEKTFLKD